MKKPDDFGMSIDEHIDNLFDEAGMNARDYEDAPDNEPSLRAKVAKYMLDLDINFGMGASDELHEKFREWLGHMPHEKVREWNRRTRVSYTGAEIEGKINAAYAEISSAIDWSAYRLTELPIPSTLVRTYYSNAHGIETQAQHATRLALGSKRSTLP